MRHGEHSQLTGCYFRLVAGRRRFWALGCHRDDRPHDSTPLRVANEQPARAAALIGRRQALGNALNRPGRYAELDRESTRRLIWRGGMIQPGRRPQSFSQLEPRVRSLCAGLISLGIGARDGLRHGACAYERAGHARRIKRPPDINTPFSVTDITKSPAGHRHHAK
jgi:hypothetical protein